MADSRVKNPSSALRTEKRPHHIIKNIKIFTFFIIVRPGPPGRVLKPAEYG
jgi:hypothetical protein